MEPRPVRWAPQGLCFTLEIGEVVGMIDLREEHSCVLPSLA